MNVDRKLIDKYNQAVPRYTSYPPANFFHENFSENDYIAAIEDSNTHLPQNISIYIHIPFCNKLCFYCGCNTTPMAEDEKIKQYIEALKKEISLVLSKLDQSRKISQIHYGGGTPNAIDAQYLHELNQLFFNDFELIDEPEIAIECHPAYLDETYVKKLKAAGFNRFSLGIQDFNENVLKNVNRKPSLLPLEELTHIIKDQDNISLNLDFIYGLPGQSVESITQTLQQAIALKPDRMVTFSYAHVPWVNKAQKILEEKGLPNPNDKINMFEAAFNLLTNNDYASIGLDHYVLKTDGLFKSQQEGNLHRNFQGYCTRQTTGQVYAFGVSGISQFQEVYAQNTKDVDAYIDLLNKGHFAISKGYKLSQEEQETRTLITNLMCNRHLNLETISTSQQEKLRALEVDGIIGIENNQLTVKEDGMLFIRNVASVFDPLFGSKGKNFSKSV